jgi:hypothetical protein
MAKSGRESLYRLKNLVEYLEDRDLGLKRDASLFEAVFNDFPVPVTIWLSDEKGLCVSRKVTGRASRGWSSPPPPPTSSKVIDLYGCSVLRLDVERNMESALGGKQMSFLSSGDGSYVWTRLTPRFTEDGKCCGVIGASWDLTASYKMFSALTRLSDSKCGVGDPEIESLKSEARDAADMSVIRVLLKEAEK